MPDTNIKAEARQLVERLPDNASWEDLQYQIYLHQAIARGLKDSREGRTITQESVRQRLGLEEP